MRSVFWLGHVAEREGNSTVFSIKGLVGNTALARHVTLDREFAVGVMTHAIEEMGYLADFLPQLYAAEMAQQKNAERGPPSPPETN